MTAIRQGDRVHLLPEWMDEGDAELEWFAIDDESQGRVTIQPHIELGIPPTYIVTVEMLKI